MVGGTMIELKGFRLWIQVIGVGLGLWHGVCIMLCSLATWQNLSPCISVKGVNNLLLSGIVYSLSVRAQKIVLYLSSWASRFSCRTSDFSFYRQVIHQLNQSNSKPRLAQDMKQNFRIQVSCQALDIPYSQKQHTKPASLLTSFFSTGRASKTWPQDYYHECHFRCWKVSGLLW